MSSGNFVIGAGTYRMRIDNPAHVHALHYAVENGCNFIDTAASYQKGRSEELVGEVLGRYKEKEIKVVTKAGYMEEDEAALFADGSYLINGSFYHSIHPEFLEYKLRKSLERMKTGSVYAFLVHNPEYILPLVGPEHFYRMLKEAFLFLEQMVEQDLISCYGISSNTLADREHMHHVALEELLRIAGEIKSDHHFKVIQFPHNIYERKALQPAYAYGGQPLSLFDYAKKKGLQTLINRPFTGSVNKRPVPILVYRNIDPGVLAADAFGTFLGALSNYAIAHQVPPPDPSAAVPVFLRENWRSFKSEKLLAMYTEGTLQPWLSNSLPSSGTLNDIVTDFCNACTQHIRNRINVYNGKLKEDLCAQHEELDRNASFSAILCTLYAKDGADVILTGMRQAAYVDDIKPLL